MNVTLPMEENTQLGWGNRVLPLGKLRSRLTILFILVGGVATGLLWFLYHKTQAASPTTRVAVEAQLRQIHQLDSDWNFDIMSSKVGLNDSYDPIVLPFQKISATLIRLEKAEGAENPDVKAQLATMRKVFAQKADLVDEFKSHNSILRNSLRFLPTAASDAKSALALHSATAKEVNTTGLVSELNSTLGETLKYAVVIDDAQREQSSSAVRQLEEAVGGLPDASPGKESLTVFLNHAHTVLRKISNEASLLSGIVKVPTVAAIDRSVGAFDAYFAKQSRESELWRKALFGYSAFLLVLVASTGLRLRQSYRKINRMNAALVAANDGLEQRVQDRTLELGDALISLRESEAQLIQSEKMSSLGQMIAGVVHEINTPLAYVRSSLETVGDQLEEVSDLVRHSSFMLSAMSAPEPDPEQLSASFAALSALTSSFADHSIAEELRQLAKDSLHGLDQIGELVVNLRNFSRLDRSKTTLFDLREGLDSTLVIARSTIRGHAVLKRYGDLPEIVCAPSQLNQVFLNLITNAAQALPADGGIITLSTGVEDAMVRVDVTDNGSGIDPKHIEKIFDPFFTTKEIGKGTGLGLSIAYKIIQEHAGRISVQSVLGQGTTFSIHLPKNPPVAG